jgi:serine/threonine protein kinase
LDGEPEAISLDSLRDPRHPELLHRVVAIKDLAPHLASHASARRRFSREAQAAAAVVHPHVIPIHNVESDDRYPYLVMQEVPGKSLQARVDAEGPLPLEEVLRIAQQTASGLAAAHAQGLIHRDIKPANILLEDQVKRVVLSDFGLARAVDDAWLSRTGIVAETPDYMSPQQANGNAIGYSTDLFSLGSVCIS